MGYKKQVFRSLAMVTQLGISVMTPIFLCIFAGCWVDNHFGTKTVLLFLLLGVLAGGRCGYHMAKITFLAGEKDDRKEREEQNRSRKEPKYEPVSRPKPLSRVRTSGNGKISENVRVSGDVRTSENVRVSGNAISSVPGEGLSAQEEVKMTAEESHDQ